MSTDERMKLADPIRVQISGRFMPDDLCVVRNCDADEAGDYRIARHGDVVDDPQWEITDLSPKDLD